VLLACVERKPPARGSSPPDAGGRLRAAHGAAVGGRRADQPEASPPVRPPRPVIVHNRIVDPGYDVDEPGAVIANPVLVAVEVVTGGRSPNKPLQEGLAGRIQPCPTVVVSPWRPSSRSRQAIVSRLSNLHSATCPEDSAPIIRFPRRRIRLPQPHLLQRSRQGRPLRRMGAASTLQRRGPSGLPLTALIACVGAHLTSGMAESRHDMPGSDAAAW
jgi:hypothetical protein